MERCYHRHHHQVQVQLQSTNMKSKWGIEGDDDVNVSNRWSHHKNYNCSFCKREFRSAQALGGHMNVHRRDRARLRQLNNVPVFQFQNPRFDSPNNPNPSCCSPPPSSSRPSLKLLVPSSSPYARDLSLVSPSRVALKSSPNYDVMMSKKKSNRGEDDHVEKCRIGCFEEDNNKVVSLDLGIGSNDHKEVLDLELRLG